MEITCVDAALIPAFLANRWQKCSQSPVLQSSLREGNLATYNTLSVSTTLAFGLAPPNEEPGCTN